MRLSADSAIVLGFGDDQGRAAAFAAKLALPYAVIAVHTFPDGESRVQLPAALPPSVLIYRSLDHPNEKLVLLMLAAAAARSLGAQQLMLVAPYLCYMRQDMAFNPGEVVSQKIVGTWLAGHFDAVVTVDPHLHRISALCEAVPIRHALAVSAAPLLGAFLRERGSDVILIGPDAESAQWVSRVAHEANCPFAVCTKLRHGDRDTTVELPSVALEGRAVVLVDDIVSSGGTMRSAARASFARGAIGVDALVVHALLSAADEQALRAAGIANLWSTDSVTHSSNRIALTGLLADAVNGIWGEL